MADISAPYAPTQSVFRYTFARFTLQIDWWEGEETFPIPESWDIRFGRLTNVPQDPLVPIWNGPGQIQRIEPHSMKVDFPTPMVANIPGSTMAVMYRVEDAGITPLLFLDIKLSNVPTSSFAPGAAAAEAIRFYWNGGNPFANTGIGASAAAERLIALESQMASLAQAPQLAVKADFSALYAMALPLDETFVMVSGEEEIDDETYPRGQYILYPNGQIIYCLTGRQYRAATV